MTLKTLTVTVTAKVSYESYGNKRLNKEAEAQITRWISDTLANEADFIPIYVVTDKTNGSYIEDNTRKVHYKVKVKPRKKKV